MLDATEEVGGIFVITADHGNAEDMVKRNAKTGAPVKDKQGNYQILTSHTCAPVSVGPGNKFFFFFVLFSGGAFNSLGTLTPLVGVRARF